MNFLTFEDIKPSRASEKPCNEMKISDHVNNNEITDPFFFLFFWSTSTFFSLETRLNFSLSVSFFFSLLVPCSFSIGCWIDCAFSHRTKHFDDHCSYWLTSIDINNTYGSSGKRLFPKFIVHVSIDFVQP